MFDFIIVGSGSSGSAMAYRLSESGKHKVLVLEYGGSDWGPLIQMPSALSYPMNMKQYDWGFVSEPEPHLGGRRLVTPRGKVIGGSSSINGMVYVRGHAKDYDTWETLGARGWGFRHVLPYFKRLESSHGGEADWRGATGPLHVTRGAMTNPLYQAFIAAGREAGYPVTEDYNGRQQEGLGPFKMTVWQGRRWSTANAYLRPSLQRRNVRLETRALARRILIDGKRATGVEYEQHGEIKTARAARDVVLAASAINSPKLLMLSGIGPADHLRDLGIPAVHHLAGVGQNLHDHLEILLQVECLEPITLNGKMSLWSKGRIGLEWLLFKTGLGATNHFESCGFIRSRAGVEYPDLQYHFLPAAIRYDGAAPSAGHGFQVHIGPNRSKSRGRLKLASADPHAPPRALFNYMSEPDDWRDFRTGIRLTREILGQPALARYKGRELSPGDQVMSDEAIDDHIRNHVESAYHPCGTCRMGAADDPLAVVDHECRVLGIAGLRIADASIIPQITNGNLNAPCIVIGEKASDHILGRDPLPPSNQEPWIHPGWQTSQR
ncbi:MAG: choline dehydrogenase [Pseudomonadota bacterium]|nr:choline dehydrogenase [Pseudomonadota bacterium]